MYIKNELYVIKTTVDQIWHCIQSIQLAGTCKKRKEEARHR